MRQDFLANLTLYGGLGLILVVHIFSFFRLTNSQLDESTIFYNYKMYSAGSFGAAAILVFAVSFIEFIISGYWLFGGEGGLTALFILFADFLTWLLFGVLFYFLLRTATRYRRNQNKDTYDIDDVLPPDMRK